MPHLPPKDKDRLLELSRTDRGEIIRDLIEANLQEISSVDTLAEDPVESRKIVIDHLKKNLLSYFVEREEVKKQEVETYE